MMLQTWQLREEGRLLDIVDPELTEYPVDEVVRFIKVALFCTQAAAHQRPGMKQVVEMLSKDVTLNEKLLTEPGVYQARTSRRLAGGSLQVASSSVSKGKPLFNPFSTSTQLDSSHMVTHMLPR